MTNGEWLESLHPGDAASQNIHDGTGRYTLPNGIIFDPSKLNSPQQWILVQPGEHHPPVSQNALKKILEGDLDDALEEA